MSRGSQPIAIKKRDGSTFYTTVGELSTTPGGTTYATTPGGTRIAYDRESLMLLRNSPLSKTPPTRIFQIPGVTINLPPQKKEEVPVAKKPTEPNTMFAMED
eukprot:TRINITY_DN226_c0_g1_i1.p1 TRINITY_DN226_c0_g1~~TRINITY_DN226_c0_g1_i1.p1  ORF type:complete len:114 (-),score=22.21 TRINITY_DN226_c0_g1_i1:116-421(-)